MIVPPELRGTLQPGARGQLELTRCCTWSPLGKAGVTAEWSRPPGLPSSACISHFSGAYQHFCKLNAQRFSAILCCRQAKGRRYRVHRQRLWAGTWSAGSLPAGTQNIDGATSRHACSTTSTRHRSLVEWRESMRSEPLSVDSSVPAAITGLTPHAWLLTSVSAGPVSKLRPGRRPWPPRTGFWALPHSGAISAHVQAAGVGCHAGRRLYLYPPERTFLPMTYAAHSSARGAGLGHPAFAECLQCCATISTGKPRAHPSSLYSARPGTFF